MRKFVLFAAALAGVAVHGESVLVRDGRPNAVLVVEGGAAELAARDLQYHVRRASGATLPIITPQKASSLPAATVRVAMGPGEMLEAEEYVLKTTGNTLVLAGSDGAAYAVSYLLDRYLNVRWLWPGETGTVVPVQKTIAIPALNVRTRPALVQRRMRMPRDLPGQAGEDLKLWALHHMLGSRSSFQFGHAFTNWYEKYHATHPEYFGIPPAGQERFFKPYDRLKLCVSNPATAEQVLAEWRTAGRPANWNVAPNDGGRGSCTCDRCRALDGIEQTPEAVWRGDAVLTGRYVDFWNRLLRRMRAERPDATLSAYAYSAYRTPPRAKLEDGMVIGFVDNYSDAALKGWSALAGRGGQTSAASQLVPHGRGRAQYSAARRWQLLCVRAAKWHARLRFRQPHGILGHAGSVLLPHSAPGEPRRFVRG